MHFTREFAFHAQSRIVPSPKVPNGPDTKTHNRRAHRPAVRGRAQPGVSRSLAQGASAPTWAAKHKPSPCRSCPAHLDPFRISSWLAGSLSREGVPALPSSVGPDSRHPGRGRGDSLQSPQAEGGAHPLSSHAGNQTAGSGPRLRPEVTAPHKPTGHEGDGGRG